MFAQAMNWCHVQWPSKEGEETNWQSPTSDWICFFFLSNFGSMEFHSCPSYSDSKFDSIFFCLLLDVYDDVEYLSSLGKAQTANVKRDAAVGVAQANRDAGIRVRTRKLKWNERIIVGPYPTIYSTSVDINNKFWK
jgi:hypothetical protein